MSAIRTVSFLSLAASALAATFVSTDTWTGANVLDAFNVMNIPDPTHGRTNYVDAATAQAQGLLANADGHLILRADSSAVLDPAGAGRNSVRLESKKTFGSNTVAVFNIHHMPQGCGTWPAVWTFGQNWPTEGEIDILEGVNDIVPNHATLHTTTGCTMPPNRAMTGSPILTDCDVNANGNTGCGVSFAEGDSYGPALNAAGGGWYALERRDDVINVWFWARANPNVPAGVRDGSNNIDTGSWGTPSATFPNTQCDIPRFFALHTVTINLTFCGDWAGIDSIYQGAGCPSTCVDFVNNNPGAFTEAFFDFEWIKLYGA